jgi:hypothetical protein
MLLYTVPTFTIIGLYSGCKKIEEDAIMIKKDPKKTIRILSIYYSLGILYGICYPIAIPYITYYQIFKNEKNGKIENIKVL